MLGLFSARFIKAYLIPMIDMISQYRSKRKATGGKYQAARKKKLYEKGGNPSFTKVDEKVKSRVISARGNNVKVKALRVSYANVMKDNKVKKVKIRAVVDNSANRNFVRRNILNKGTIIDTEIGKARVTSRPAQDGIVNAVFIEK